ncbi:Maf family protein [Altererythrobacter sp. GH1-8]|uniref:Maf family protein n=1 Tax=Altererythrobacter sp. GH1-8 TaxID=3349333 RepID=UPI00374CCC9D
MEPQSRSDTMLQNEPIILASKSASRRAMLDAAGIQYEAIPAEIDERAVEAAWTGGEEDHVVAGISAAKALAVAKDHPAPFVLGSDSLVVVDGKRFDKPASREDAAEHLRFFSGKTLELYAGAALVLDGLLKWECWDVARLEVRDLSDAFIDEYLEREWPAVSGCVGVFRIEGLGIQLFEHIDGSHFTILGMPLMRVLWALRQFGAVKG